jgi:predicted TPR repeat methyltransferase
MMTQAAQEHDVPTLMRRVREMVREGRIAAARPLLSAVARIAPPSPELWEVEARLLLREGDVAAALATLDRAVAMQPGAVELLVCRAGARAQAGDMRGALCDAADAVLAAPQEARAKALLGALLLQAKRPAEALPCLAEAVAAAPDEIEARLALARAQELCGAPEAAAATLAEGIARTPTHVRLRTEAVLLQARLGRFTAAVALAEQARLEGCADACVLGLLGHALSSLGRHDEAARAYAEALKLAPEDPYVRHLVAAAGLVADLGRAPAEYVRVVFDGYAARFDSHLIGLGYRVPGLARAALADAVPGGPVLDLGCGTGLMALALSDLPIGPFVGVDLSPRMLAEAAQRSLYAELHEADIETFLAAEQRRFPLMLAGDVLPYFGSLGPLFGAVAARLAPGGRFLCSVELLEGAPCPGWQLGPLGRYRHAPEHLREAALAAGMQVLILRPEVIRQEQDAPVPGLFAVLEAAR